MGKKIAVLFALLFFFFFSPCLCAENRSISLGYGFGFLNPESKPYHLTYTKGLYDFFHVSFARETNIYEKIWLCAEPFVAYQLRPKGDLDLGFTLSGKFHVNKNFYINIGVGIAYTSYTFKEQGTHFPFILQGGIGYRWKDFFIEDRFKHYSNAGLARPNMSINSNLVLIGIYF